MVVLQQALLSQPQVQPALVCSLSQPSLSLAPPVPSSLSSGCGGQDLLEKAEYVMHDSNQLPAPHTQLIWSSLGLWVSTLWCFLLSIHYLYATPGP